MQTFSVLEDGEKEKKQAYHITAIKATQKNSSESFDSFELYSESLHGQNDSKNVKN